MAINIFEGARRIALLIAGVATIGTVIGLVTNEPYMPIKYSIAYPTGSFVRMEDSCPAGRKGDRLLYWEGLYDLSPL